MTPENLDTILEAACGSPEYYYLCIAIGLYKRDGDVRRLQQIGECLMEIIDVETKGESKCNQTT